MTVIIAPSDNTTTAFSTITGNNPTGSNHIHVMSSTSSSTISENADEQPRRYDTNDASNVLNNSLSSSAKNDNENVDVSSEETTDKSNATLLPRTVIERNILSDHQKVNNENEE